ncbi:MAG: hypothetical protein K1X57_14190 [Gemmataceae bacterium]|nr:hypothetical protein [Gemmataceae bacterium]
MFSTLRFRKTNCKYTSRRGRVRLWVRALEERTVPAVVTTNADTGVGSLRQAIIDANATPGPDTITFDTAGVFATAQSISVAGEMAITDDLTIIGPGQNRLSLVNVNAAGTNSRFFNIAGAAALTVNISGMTLTGGNSTSAGGAVVITDESVTFTDTTFIRNNTNTTGGGAIAITTTDGLLTLNGCNFQSNSTSGTTADGGAIFVGKSTNLAMTDTTMSGNSSGDGGGAVYAYGGVTVSRSTISNNIAVNGGGAFFLKGITGVMPAQLVFENTTIYGNTARDGGAFRVRDNDTTLVMRNCTTVGNVGLVNGGAINRFNGLGGIQLENSIVAGNTDDPGIGSVSPDIENGSTTLSYQNSVIGNLSGTTNLLDLGGNLAPGTDLKLGILAGNGGATLTIRPLPGSPLIDAGAANALTVDQRGLPRALGTVDIGSVEVDTVAPTATTTLSNVTLAGGTTYTFQVTYADDVAVAVSTLGSTDLQVTGPGGFNVLATFNGVDINTPGTPRVATYSFTAPGGTWDNADTGVYTVSMEAGQVTDGTNAVPTGIVGRFTVAKFFTVSTTADSGAGSLRQAILDANANIGPDAIVFDPVAFTGPATINLTGAELAITDSVTITGTGSNKLAILALAPNSTSQRHFNIAGAGLMTVSISDLALAGGHTTSAGGSVTTTDENVTFTNVVFFGNASTAGGGAVTNTGIARIVFNNCVLYGNSATGTANGGGAIRIQAGGNVAVINSTVTGNVAGGNGGAIYATGTTTASGLKIINSTVSNNQSLNNEGGGILFRNTVGMFGMLIQNSTISGNTGASNGGGLRFTNIVGTINILNSTIVGNTARFNGGGMDWATPGSPAPSMNVTSSIFAGNSAPLSGPDIANGGSQVLNFSNSMLGNSLTGNFVDLGGNSIDPASPLLGKLSGNGGSTLTIVPLPGSPAIDAGSNPSGLTTDQRGSARLFGTATDMGAVEIDGNIPRASVGALSNITAAGGTSYSFQITYSDDVAMKASTFDNADVRVTGPFGFSVLATKTAVDVPGDGVTRVVTYQFTPPGGAWDSNDFGLYSVNIEANQVTDTSGTPVAAGVQGFFSVYTPSKTPIVVNATNDESTDTDGKISLREAILAANLNPGYDSISFDPVVFASPVTITLGGTEMAINDSLVIAGTGQSNLTVAQAAGAAATTRRVFNISGNQYITVNVSDMTLTGGTASSAGGAVTIADENVTFTNVRITGNTTNTTGGGAIALGTALGQLTLIGCTIDGNTTTGTAADGGAIRGASQTTITIQNSVISGNTTGDDGGAIYFIGNGNAGGLRITGSSIVNNRATSTTSSVGGAINVVTNINIPTPYGFFIRNSTISGNSAGLNGGAIDIGTGISGTLTIQNSTITNNTAAGVGANQGGGGIHSSATAAPFPVINIESTILSGNLNANGPDVFTLGTVNYKTSALGSATGISVLNDNGGNLTIGQNLFLGGLAYNGGLAGMLTHLPGGTSPVRDAGSNPAGLTTDQRGGARLLNSGVDIGSVESVGGIPSAAATSPNVAVSGGALQTITVQYDDETSIKTSTFGSTDIRITGPNGFNVLATFKSATPNTNAKTETATYEFVPPGGTWDGLDSGTYTISMEAGQVTDNAGNAVPAGPIGSFQVVIPRSYVVLNTNNSGAGSLRQALLDANATGGTLDTITFDAGVFSSPSTITLTTGELAISDSVLITGPGSGKLTINGSSTGRLFNIGGAGTLNVTVSGMTLTKGSVAAAGGAILIDNESVTLTDLTILGNTSSATGGGAIAVASAGGSVTISNSTLSNNSATGGGAVRLAPGTSFSLTGSAVANNTSTGVGGGIAVNPLNAAGAGVSVFVLNSTISGNLASGDGAGLYFAGVVGAGGFTVRNSTVSGNRITAGNGGGIRLRNMDGTFDLQNSTVANNTSTANGGGMDWFHPATFAPTQTVAVNITSTVFANNVATIAGGEDIRNDNNVTIPPVQLLNSFIETTGGFTSTDLGGSTVGLGAGSALLGALGANGGPTLTHVPQPLSPLLDKGTNPAGLITDQRGFVRSVGTIDIGSVEVDPNIPVGTGGPFAPVTSPGGTLYTFTVTYSDNSAIKVSTLDNNDIRVTGPGGFNVLATFVSVDINSDGTPRVTTYSFVPPGGSWDGFDLGTYTVSIEPNQVTDDTGTFVPATTLGTISVSFPFTVVVDEVSDVVDGNLSKGKVSLREALNLANSNVGQIDSITFDPVVFAGATTINLDNELSITDPVDISGTGATKLTIQPAAGKTIRNLGIDLVTSAGAVTISNIRFTGGNVTGAGGAINNVDSKLTLTSVVVEGNTASADGGGIEVSSTSGSALTIVNSIVRNNVSTGGHGGGIESHGGAAIVVTNSLISGNTAAGADGDGGGIYFFSGGTLLMTGSTVSGNRANGTGQGGGGIYLFGTTATIINSTIANNSATNNGGGIANFSATNLTLNNSTVAGNSAGNSGGGVFASAGTLTIFSSSVAQNTKNTGTGHDVSAGTAQVDFSNIGDSVGITTLNGGLNQNDISPNLGALGNNGGFLLPDGTTIPTMLPGAGSVLKNNGADSLTLTNDQRGFNRDDGGGVDIGAVELQATPSKVTAVQINGGAVQRSRVTTLKVTFDTPVTVANPNAAFTLDRVTPTTGSVTLSSVLDGSGLFMTITFTGGLVDGAAGKFSLQDGRYTLTVVPAQFSGSGVDGNAGVLVNNKFDSTPYGTPTPTSPATGIFRLFGDASGNGKVESDDFLSFRLAFLSSNDAFDFDGNGTVDSGDFLRFRLGFLQQIV